MPKERAVLEDLTCTREGACAVCEVDTGLSNRPIPLVTLRDSGRGEALTPKAMQNFLDGRIHTAAGISFILNSGAMTSGRSRSHVVFHLTETTAWENTVPEAVRSQDAQELKSNLPGKTRPSRKQVAQGKRLINVDENTGRIACVNGSPNPATEVLGNESPITHKKSKEKLKKKL